ncbi:MAG: hypothetical protein IJB61_04060 [Bacteroides sp]|nr:hypothetical protein [Bacteroides sp.]
MRKLTYAIALSTLLLAGCSQDEGIMENKGELVTLNYKVSLGDGTQSRTGESELAVNKLLCVIFESDTGIEQKREIVDVTNGSATYSPKLFNNIKYKIVFWAYYLDSDNNSCFDLSDMKAVRVNMSNYDKGNFEENKFKDAYSGIHEIELKENKQTPAITLTRPFGKINVYTSKADYDAAVALGSTPSTGILNIGSCNKTFNAYTQEWNNTNDTNIELNTKVSAEVITYQGQDCYLLANEYVFANGTVSTTNLKVKDNNSKEIYSSTIANMPLGKNMRTNLFNSTLLTGGGVTYTIIIETGFSDIEKEENI